MILMQYGDVIKGDSTIPGHAGWIAIGSAQFGVGRGISSIVQGSAKDRETSSPNISEVVVTKVTDLTSTLLFAEACVGQSVPKCTLSWLQTKKDEHQEYMKVELFNVLISGYSVSSSGDLPSESISLTFSKIIMSYASFKDGNEQVDSDPKGYDAQLGKLSVIGATKLNA